MRILTKHPRCSMIVLSMVLVCLCTGTLRAQNPFEDAIKQLSSDNVKGYLQPFVNAVGANLNSGVYHTAAISEDGLNIQLQFVGMGTMIGDAEKTYNAVAPAGFDQTPTPTATVFGEIGSTVHSAAPGIDYHFQNGQVRTTFVPFAVPQLTVGNFFGTQGVLRYVPVPEMNGFPKTTLFGIGLRHSITRYIPLFPADLAATAFYENLTIGVLIEAHAINFGAQISKSFSVATVYGGLQYETSTITVHYTYTGQGATPNTKIQLDLDGENTIRATVGAGLDLAIFHLNADVNVGKVIVFSGAIGFGL